jgi:hypothetical protein
VKEWDIVAWKERLERETCEEIAKSFWTRIDALDRVHEIYCEKAKDTVNKL